MIREIRENEAPNMLSHQIPTLQFMKKQHSNYKPKGQYIKEISLRHLLPLLKSSHIGKPAIWVYTEIDKQD